MFVNGIPFLVTRSRDIRLNTAKFLPSRTAKQLSSSLTKIVKIYAHGVFTVCLVMMDKEFEKIKDEFDKVVVNTTAAREHVREIESDQSHQGPELIRHFRPTSCRSHVPAQVDGCALYLCKAEATR